MDGNFGPLTDGQSGVLGMVDSAGMGKDLMKKVHQDRTTYTISTKESRKAGKRSFAKKKKGKSKKKSRGKT